MTRQDPGHDRTLEDDRAELAADPNEGSPLVDGEGAPLAEDDAPHEERPPMVQALLGGAPVVITPEDQGGPSAAGSLTTRDDRPIGD